MLTLEAFMAQLAHWADVPGEALQATTDLTRDLGLDSLALEQVLAGVESLLPRGSLTEFWRTPTVSALYALYRQGQGQAPDEGKRERQ